MYRTNHHSSLGPADELQSLPISIEDLYVCRICFGIYGRPAWYFRGSLYPGCRQDCGCRGNQPPEPWPHFEFPEAVAFCRCCGDRIVPSGARHSIWFCSRCLVIVRELNRLCGNDVIPTSRISLLDQVDPITIVGETIDHFPPGIPHDWFERVELLDEHRAQTVEARIQQLPASLSRGELRLADYLRASNAQGCRSNVAALTLGEAFRLPENLIRAAIDIAAS